MSIKFTKFSSILLITAISSLFAFEAKAEEPLSLADTFEEAYFQNTGNAYDRASIWGQIKSITGVTGFSDQQITADSKLIDTVYKDAMKAQSEVGAPLKTRDLQNPYTTSIFENPDYLGN